MEELTRHDLAWCARRLPRDVKDLLKREGEKVFIAGGFIRSCIANEPVNDIDVFTATASHAKELATALAAPHKPYETANAYTVFTRHITTQFIHRWSFTHPFSALQSFDFTVAKAAIWWQKGTVYPGWQSACDENFYPDLAAKRLVYTYPQRNEDAGGSILRLLKFYPRAYRAPLETVAGLVARLMSGVRTKAGFEALRSLGMSERDLASQLTGLLREVDPVVDPDADGHVDTVVPQDGDQAA